MTRTSTIGHMADGTPLTIQTPTLAEYYASKEALTMGIIEKALDGYRNKYFNYTLVDHRATLGIHPDQMDLWAEQNRWSFSTVVSVIAQFNEAGHDLAAELDFYNDPDSFAINVFRWDHRGDVHSVYGDLRAFEDLHEQLPSGVRVRAEAAALGLAA